MNARPQFFPRTASDKYNEIKQKILDRASPYEILGIPKGTGCDKNDEELRRLLAALHTLRSITVVIEAKTGVSVLYQASCFIGSFAVGFFKDRGRALVL